MPKSLALIITTSIFTALLSSLFFHYFDRPAIAGRDSQIVIAEQFILVDSKGLKRATLSTDGSGNPKLIMECADANSMSSVVIGATKDGAHIALSNSVGSQSAAWYTSGKNNVTLSFNGNNGKPRIRIASRPERDFIAFAQGKTHKLIIQNSHDHGPQITLNDEKGNIRTFITYNRDKQMPLFSMFYPNKEPGCTISMLPLLGMSLKMQDPLRRRFLRLNTGKYNSELTITHTDLSKMTTLRLGMEDDQPYFRMLSGNTSIKQEISKKQPEIWLKKGSKIVDKMPK